VFWICFNSFVGWSKEGIFVIDNQKGILYQEMLYSRSLVYRDFVPYSTSQLIFAY